MREFYQTEEGKEIAKNIGLTRKTKIASGEIVPLSGKDHPAYGRTWEELYSKKWIICQMKRLKKAAEDSRIVKVFVTRSCACGCGKQFRVQLSGCGYDKHYVQGHHTKGMKFGPRSEEYKKKRSVGQTKLWQNPEYKEKQLAAQVLGRQNHKVVKVEWLEENADTYDITVEKNHNFSLSSGIFVHNSMEDLIVPVWGDVGDISIDKIGGETDIRWIVDIEELRNQLASSLRCPTVLLGGHVEEATGSLGSEAISKLDIRFARTARKLQRALREGITRICQIHLAYMNMDPDPNLFEVNLSETSTAEDEELKNALDTGVDIIDKYMKMFEEMNLNLDKVELFNYMNQKILKLNDLDLKDYVKSDTITSQEFRESIQKKVEEVKKKNKVDKISWNCDFMASLPLSESKGRYEEQKNWETRYKDCIVKIDKSTRKTKEQK